jgi:ABC-type glycerol-3-phosphate transport system substrate-binding protein
MKYLFLALLLSSQVQARDLLFIAKWSLPSIKAIKSNPKAKVIDVEKNPELVKAYGIRGVPTLIKRQ